VEALDQQEPFVNPTLANQALALLARLFRYGTISYHGAFVSLSSLSAVQAYPGRSQILATAQKGRSTHNINPNVWLNRLFSMVRVVEKMQEGKAITVLPLMEELSTQAAADLLGVSRQFFVRECEAHKLPFHYTGTHRRVLLKDLLDYKKGRDQARRESIVRIARQLKELGDYDKFIPPEE
jgi:excisionase family DNA binding protein